MVSNITDWSVLRLAWYVCLCWKAWLIRCACSFLLIFCIYFHPHIGSCISNGWYGILFIGSHKMFCIRFCLWRLSLRKKEAFHVCRSSPQSGVHIIGGWIKCDLGVKKFHCMSAMIAGEVDSMVHWFGIHHNLDSSSSRWGSYCQWIWTEPNEGLEVVVIQQVFLKSAQKRLAKEAPPKGLSKISPWKYWASLWSRWPISSRADLRKTFWITMNGRPMRFVTTTACWIQDDSRVE